MNSFQPIDYHAFMLRLWRAGVDGPWRVSLEDPHTRQTHHFTSLKRAMAFVEKRVVGEPRSQTDEKTESG